VALFNKGNRVGKKNITSKLLSIYMEPQVVKMVLIIVDTPELEIGEKEILLIVQ